MSNPQEVGEYISALSNSASLHNKPYAYLFFGIDNGTHNVVGTKFKPKQRKIGNEELENWIARQLTPRIDFEIHEYYQDLIISYLEKHKQASRKDIDELLFDKMPDVLNDVQKRTKIKNLIYEMSKRRGHR